ncbi:MAG: hypothetical protein Q8Q63_08255 [Phaeovulum sp.]|uniref:hypothetical protein n=1 Tax=Phaeovulum sp. TaxID=2934796 RepID=UPI0027312E1A|nr:hypothetical protein [Phaeovulum sp.]MDP2064227.1 hypothetical protein [Phaeovulum sp.]MDP3861560.1 hypothetical protein [Phaeovulum sp.]
MKRITTLTAILALTASAALAQEPFVAGAEFMLNWDMDGDGQVTLAEATERRESIFYMFDLDGNGVYSADELAGIDEHKALEAELGKGAGQAGNAAAAGHVPGQGAGQNAGQTVGGGQAAKGTSTELTGTAAEILMFDADANGVITMEEFLAGTGMWLAQRDLNGDAVITLADFGPGL